MSNDKFFSKSNLFPAIWALVVGLIGFFGGLIWDNISGPDEVMVLNQGVETDTTVTIIEFKPDKDYFDNLTQMTAKSINRQYSRNQSSQKKETIDSLAIAIAKDYQTKFDSLKVKTFDFAMPQLNEEIRSIPSPEIRPTSSQLQRPLFKMPKIVEGYTDRNTNSYAAISINSEEYSKNEKVVVSIDFFNKETLQKITPIFISILEKKSENRFYLIWSEQYAINELNNMISFSADFKPGNYDLTVGFYNKNELNIKYPHRYAKKFNIEIK